MAGKLEMQSDGLYRFSSYETNIKQEGCSMCCCCGTQTNSNYEINKFYIGKKNREDIINIMKSENESCTFCLRITSFLLHFASYYMILYPIILIIGMIPFFGAIGATVLVFVAFLFSLITYLFIICCAWIFARPFMSTVLIALIIVLIVLTKYSSENINKDQNQKASNRFARILSDEDNFLEY